MKNISTKVFEINGLSVNSNLEFDKDLFDKIYNKGISASSEDFGYQFAHKCSKFAAFRVEEKSCTLKEASTLLGNALFLLNDSHLAYGIDLYRAKLIQLNELTISFDGKLTTQANQDIVLGMTQLEPQKNKTTKDEPLKLNAKIEVKDDGSVYIYNDKNQLHAQGIPAVTLADGTQKWFLEGIETTQDLNKKQVLSNLSILRATSSNTTDNKRKM